MMPRTDRKKTRKQLDDLWAIKVKDRDFHRCHLCYHKGTDAHHIFEKARGDSVRWDLNNGITLCRECHAWVHNGGESSFLARLYHENKYKFEILQAKSKEILHLKNYELVEMLEGMKRL
jgi:5-methylcytosine-specific restriction endonuclease McrA